MTNIQARNIIRNEANRLGVKYRITASGEVHFYGVMPGTNVTGWYFVGADAVTTAKEIEKYNVR